MKRQMLAVGMNTAWKCCYFKVLLWLMKLSYMNRKCLFTVICLEEIHLHVVLNYETHYLYYILIIINIL